MTAKEAREKSESVNKSIGTGRALKNVLLKIQREAEKGGTEIIYPFDDMAMKDATKTAIILELKILGYTYTYKPTQDPGHPCDRPFESISW